MNSLLCRELIWVMADHKPEAFSNEMEAIFSCSCLATRGEDQKRGLPTVTYVMESPGKYNQFDLTRGNKRKVQLESYIPLGAYSIFRPCIG